MATVILYGLAQGDFEARLREAAPRGVAVLRAASPDEVYACVEETPADVDAVALHDELDEMLRVAHRVRRADPVLEMPLFCPPEALPLASRAILHAPELGLATRAHPDDADLRSVLDLAVEATRKRRNYREIVTGSQARLESFEGTRPLPGPVLDRLLEYAPIGVVLVEPPERVVALNRRARDLLARKARSPVGGPFAAGFPSEARARARALVRAAQQGEVTPASFEIPGSGGARHLWATAAPLGDSPSRGCMVILEDVTQRVRAREQIQAYAARLEATNVELTRSNEELEAYAQIVSHDLKAPLRGIRTLAQALIEDHGEEVGDEILDHLQTLGGLGVRMSGLIDRLLDFSRVGHVDLALQETDLDAVLSEQLELLRVQIAETAAEVRRPASLPRMRCDGARVGEIFQNLIGNAIKYNEASRPWVELGVVGSPRAPTPRRRPEGAPPGAGPIFYVRDNGIGIPERHEEEVFQVFRRLHARDAYGGGSGAGLAIVRRIVERHGGVVWVEATPGEGSVFYFTLSAAARGVRPAIG